MLRSCVFSHVSGTTIQALSATTKYRFRDTPINNHHTVCCQAKKTMKFHIKSSRRNRNRQRSNSQNDEHSSASAPSPSILSLSTAVAPSSTSSADPTGDVVPLRSCLRKSPINKEVKQSSMLQVVRFQDVHVREFEVIVGDNPSCSSGAPIR